MTFRLIQTGIEFPDGTQQSTRFDTTDDRGSLISINQWSEGGTYTWNRPSGCRQIRVVVVGAGGGGSGHCESGGAGGYAEKWIDVSGISSVTVTVASGGAGAGYYSNCADGGTSSFGSYVSAAGGYGANRNWQHTGGHGGIGHGGDINLRGGGGVGHENEGNGSGTASYWGGGCIGSHHNAHGNNTENHCAPGGGGKGTWTSYGRGEYGRAGAVMVWNFA